MSKIEALIKMRADTPKDLAAIKLKLDELETAKVDLRTTPMVWYMGLQDQIKKIDPLDLDHLKALTISFAESSVMRDIYSVAQNVEEYRAIKGFEL